MRIFLCLHAAGISPFYGRVDNRTKSEQREKAILLDKAFTNEGITVCPKMRRRFTTFQQSTDKGHIALSNEPESRAIFHDDRILPLSGHSIGKRFPFSDDSQQAKQAIV